MTKINRFYILLIFLALGTYELSAQNYATFYFYRKYKLTATGVDFKVYFNKLEKAQIANGGRVELRYYTAGRVNLMCGVFSEYMPAGDNYNNNIPVEVEKGKVYYFKGEGKTLTLVPEEQGKEEYNRSSSFKSDAQFIDDKIIDYGATSNSGETKKEPEQVKTPVQSDAKIVMLSPKNIEGDYNTVSDNLKVSGYVNSQTEIKNIKINNEIVSNNDPNFSKIIDLKEGLNKISIIAEDAAGKLIKFQFNAIREVAEIAQETPKTSEEQPTYRGSGDPFKGTNIANASKEIKVGKYYALIIAVDAYSGVWTPLKNAVNDGKAIEALLKAKYKVDVFKTLYNVEASRTNIIEQFEWLVENVKENDNVMIFYSGHGELKKDLNKGYWVPSDAKTKSTAQYISNSEIQTYLTGIKSKHTLLVSDACFSGDIFRGTTTSIPYENSEKYYFNVYNAKSRQAISSGGIEPVMDGGQNGHSVFAYYLLQALQNNENKYYDAAQLFNKIKIPVVNNSEQSPGFNPIKNSGDEGGQFLFIKK